MRKIVFFFLIVSLAVSLFISKPEQFLQVSTNNPIWLGKVIIDAGHGGFDGGAEAEDGTLEKDINLKIALKLKELLKFSGYEVIMTRESDSGTEKDSNESIANRKKSDMYRRLNIITENPDAVFISIHLNKFHSQSANGAQVFYSKNNVGSKTLADSVQNSIVKLVQTENKRKVKMADNSIFLLKKANVPAIIIECGFLSNENDLNLLKQNEYQSKIAYAIFCGFLDYNKQE